MNNIDNMLTHTINKDEDGFADAFGEEMKERLATSIIDKNLNTARDLLSDEEIDSEEQEQVEEGEKKDVKKEKPEESEKMKKYREKWDSRKLKSRAVSTGMEGTIRTESVEPLEELRGAKFFPSGYTFKTTKDAQEFMVALKHMGLKKNDISQKGKNISIDLEQGKRHDILVMIKNLAKDMKASINESNVINAIKEAITTELGVSYTLKDSENIHILPEDADSIIQIHDTLNAENQEVLRDMLSETKESYQKVLNFCNKKAQ